MESQSFNISFPVSFWTRYRASYTLLHRLWNTWVGYAFFVGVPTIILIVAVSRGWDLSRPGMFGLPGWAVLCACYGYMFIFFPLLQMFQLAAASRRNRTLLGMQHQAFTADGVTCSGEAFNTTLSWQAIHKAVETKQFFFLFFSARGAFFIPKVRIRATSELEQLRSVLRTYLHDKAHLQTTAQPIAGANVGDV
ncbi:MAG TPA: YcxB family protein [Chthoniobacterales bacterium]|jgi:cellulose synthase/poly-beta-1,6-N-acetylglucosamine synthase-like glycosyltransferase